jgi:hypothetical protein
MSIIELEKTYLAKHLPIKYLKVETLKILRG